MMNRFLQNFIERVDATPDPRTQEQAPYQLRFTVTQPHTRTVTVDGQNTALYEITRQSKFGVRGDKVTITSLVDGGKEVALLNWHTFPPQMKIQFSQQSYEISIKTSDHRYNSYRGLGELTWKGTGAVAYGSASWELRDKLALVASVSVDDTQKIGIIKVWRTDLNADALEEVVINSIAHIEDYKRTIRTGRASVMGVLLRP
ncbi:hypothetical protein BKA66DRAFT_605927 [Pyrenochaeta sp. MPI-SDFR-AT-0127]|nr:hypothetical protein BKA66DRAFT_605927 [Pyrenochaeta sp. MPI-SDFR-AT-0127]